MNRQSLFTLFLLVTAILSVSSFAPAASIIQSSRGVASSFTTTTQKSAYFPSSSFEVSASTLDPTTILSDIFAGLIGTPAILAVPIVAALAVASLIAFIIVSYASPEVEDDE